jgi:hypothetical protein
MTEAEFVAAEEKGACKNLVKIDKTERDLVKYERWLAENEVDITAIREQRRKAVHQPSFFQDLLKPYDAASMLPSRANNHDEAMSGERV